MTSVDEESSPETVQAPSITTPRSLTRSEIGNLTLALLAWACTVSNVTLVVGTSGVILIDIGGATNLTSLPLGTFFFGASLVSWCVTPWLFVQWGRQYGFFLGIALGMVGTVLGMVCIAVQSPAWLVVAMIFFGMAMGVGFFLRFAAVEVVPPHWQARAVTLVVSGGVIAAFAGPESAQGMKDAFGKEYMGVFVMTGIFNLANALCIGLLSFPQPKQPPPLKEEESNNNNLTEDEESARQLELQQKQEDRVAFAALLRSRQFLVPMLVASLTWAAMSMPMSIVRVVMGQVGYTARQSLTTIELHFVGMYAPGFISGSLISQYGPPWMIVVGIVVFGVAVIFNFVAQDESDQEHGLALWILGLFWIGVGWNFCFTSATIWTTALYKQQPRLQPQVQAANDCSMFFLGGAWLVSASYIFEAGGEELEGWAVLNGVVVGLLVLMGVLLGGDWMLTRWERGAIGEESPEKALVAREDDSKKDEEMLRGDEGEIQET
eukprot:CAMPEP_0172473932 /NCGR_PEP_ID=MMETSP1065-20121228/69103_1 /TAXON_ID=265537 /ORGANISM="Amphiprora paludosa, Strain CCMP125" /LENGTH=491 /DNA_ID=CAMNT_0013232109 /DNA_START=154 /DNA_END=1629 /DNA_ORIENTATION=+